MVPFETEFRYFIEHQDELVEKYFGKILVLRGPRVEGVYNEPIDALVESQAKWPLGTFMIQRCIPGPEAYTVTLY